MKHKICILSFVLAAFAFTSFQLSAKTLLRLNLQKGVVYEVNTTTTSNMDQEMMGQQIKMEQVMNMQLVYKIADVLANKNYLIEYSVEKMKMDLSANGQQMSFDSQAGSNPQSEKLKSMIGQVVKMEVTTTGKIVKVEGLDAFISKVADDKMLGQIVPMLSSEDGFKSFADQAFGYIPEDEIEQGSKWSSAARLVSAMNLDIKQDFELVSISGNDASMMVKSSFNGQKQVEQMGMKMDMQIDGNQNGTMVVDITDGWIRSQKVNQNIKMVMKMKNPQTGEDVNMPIDMTSVIETKVEKK